MAIEKEVWLTTWTMVPSRLTTKDICDDDDDDDDEEGGKKMSVY